MLHTHAADWYKYLDTSEESNYFKESFELRKSEGLAVTWSSTGDTTMMTVNFA